jgi:uroporphyrinogen decarboxylase
VKIDRPFKEGADFDHFRKVIMRETREGPVPIFEILADPEIMSEVTGIDFPPEKALELINIATEPTPEQLDLGIRLIDLSLAFSQAVGYDYVTMWPVTPLTKPRLQLSEDPKKVRDVSMRAWENEHAGLITSREEFEAFPWPSTDMINLLPIELVAPNLPPGMKVLEFCQGIYEDLRILMGFEAMAIKSIEEPELVGDILEQLTIRAIDYVNKAAAHPAVGAIFYGEDMGFKTGTILSPKFMREWLFPRQKRIAEACHKHGKPFLLHSCGKVGAIMEDLINVVGISGRHSFEDQVEPVEEVYRKYGDRISILGGLDVDLLARATEEQVRARVRQILTACAPGGGYCMGAGNSLTNYCKIENYYTMLDETRKWNGEHN